MKSPQYARRAGTAAILALAVGGASACATGPHLTFSGNWVAQLPAGSAILFTAQQVGPSVTGTVTNLGPLSMNPEPLSGSVTSDGVTLAFTYPPGSRSGPPQSAVGWTYHGEFTSATTITGTVVSATGITGQMVITHNNGPVPVARVRRVEVAAIGF